MKEDDQHGDFTNAEPPHFGDLPKTNGWISKKNRANFKRWTQEGSSRRGAVGTFRRAHFDVDPRAERGGRCGLEPGAAAPPDETRRGRLFL